MNYFSKMTTMLSEAKNYDTEQFIYDMVILVNQILEEKTPLLVREELKKVQEDLIVNVKTYLNGRQIDLSNFESIIRKEIDNELNKIK